MNNPRFTFSMEDEAQRWSQRYFATSSELLRVYEILSRVTLVMFVSLLTNVVLVAFLLAK